MLLAVRRGNGKLYANHIPDDPAKSFFLFMGPAFFFVVGLLTLPVGVGLIFFWAWWKLQKFKVKMFQSRGLIVKAKNYIKSLNGAIEI